SLAVASVVVQPVLAWTCTVDVALVPWLPAMSVTRARMPAVLLTAKAVDRVMVAVPLVRLPVVEKSPGSVQTPLLLASPSTVTVVLLGSPLVSVAVTLTTGLTVLVVAGTDTVTVGAVKSTVTLKGPDEGPTTPFKVE